MTRQETTKILAYLREIYPQGKEVTKNTVSVWHDLLAGYPYEVAFQAAKNTARTWKGYIMPPPSEIIRQAEMLMPEDTTAIDLWRIAERQIKRGTVITQEDFDRLPAPVRRYFGGPSAIRDLALLDMEQLPNERARFLRQIGGIVEQDKARANLPPDAKQAIDGIVKKLEYKE